MLPSDLVTKLSNLFANGEFPTPSHVLQGLLTRRKNAPDDLDTQISLLLSEPSLAIRLIHLIRGEIHQYERKPDTLRQALTLLDDERVIRWAKSLVTIDRFSSGGRSEGAYERTFAIAVVVSLAVPTLLAVAPENLRIGKESGILLGWCASSGVLATVFTYPYLFESIFNRMEDRSESFEEAIIATTGFSFLGLSAAICRNLDLPDDIRKILTRITSSSTTTNVNLDSLTSAHTRLLQSAVLLAHTILLKPRRELGAVLEIISDDLGIEIHAVREVVAQLPDAFDTRCKTLGIRASLPDHIVAFSKGRGGGTFVTEQITLANLHSVRIEELRESIRRSDPISSVILSTMEFLVWDYGFDRCVFMLVEQEKQRLGWSSYLGRTQCAPIDFEIMLSKKSHGAKETTTIAISEALEKGLVTFDDFSLLPNGMDTTIVPIGYRARVIGALYCDRLERRTTLSKNELATLTTISELLDECIRFSNTTIKRG